LHAGLTKSTDKRQNVKQITAFPTQQCLRERALMLRYKYTACLVHIRMLTDGSIFLTGISASCWDHIQNHYKTNRE